MKRLLIFTVGKTHSGKTTFARELEQHLENSLVVDQDNHAEFINTHYKKLLPKTGANLLKYTVTDAIVGYATSKTDLHLILCMAHRSRQDRTALTTKFRKAGFTTVLVHFAIPDDVLAARVATTTRSTNVFRSASSFQEVLSRQNSESNPADIPTPDETDYFFELSSNDESPSVTQKIIQLTREP